MIKVLGIIVVLALIGGAGYWYTQQPQTGAPADESGNPNLGEGESARPTAASVVAESVVGKWLLNSSSVGLVVEFKDDGVLEEHRAEELLRGTWKVSMNGDMVMLDMMLEGSPHGSSCAVSKLTPETLEVSCEMEGEVRTVAYTKI